MLDLLYANFHTDEPMSKTLKIFDGEFQDSIMTRITYKKLCLQVLCFGDPGTHRIPEADDFTLRALTENLSLMAVDPVCQNYDVARFLKLLLAYHLTFEIIINLYSEPLVCFLR